MDAAGPLVADRPRTGTVARLSAPQAEGTSKTSDHDLIRRLLTPAQRLRYSLVPGPLHGWLRSLRRWRRDEAELHLLAGLVDPHRTAIDVGANKGTYTWFLARLCRHVYAYEPNPAMRWMLQKCTPKNVTIFPRALSDHPGEGLLRIPHRNGRFANSVGTLRETFDDTRCETVSVAKTRLDDDGLADVGFLKIDVEGHEQEVLRGAREIIARDRPVLLIEIVPGHHDRPVDETIDFVERLGYRVHVAQGTQLREWSTLRQDREQRSRPGESNSAFRNYIFLPVPHAAAKAA